MKEYNLFSLKGKTIVMTGSTGGLGTSAARHLAWAGAGLELIGRNQKKLDTLAEELRKEYGTEVHTYLMDSSDEGSIQSVRDEILDTVGRIDGLYNMAGIHQHGSVCEHSEEDLVRLFRVNVAATYACCRYFGEVMCRQMSGSILNIASIAAVNILHTELTMSGYSVVQLTKAFAGEFGPYQVRVNCISPGYMDTRMNGTKGARPINTDRFNTSEAF